MSHILTYRHNMLYNVSQIIGYQTEDIEKETKEEDKEDSQTGLSIRRG